MRLVRLEILCCIHCAIAFAKNFFGMTVPVTSSFPVLFLFNLRFVCYMSGEIQPVTVGTGAGIVTEAANRNGNEDSGELVSHSDFQY